MAHTINDSEDAALNSDSSLAQTSSHQHDGRQDEDRVVNEPPTANQENSQETDQETNQETNQDTNQDTNQETNQETNQDTNKIPEQWILDLQTVIKSADNSAVSQILRDHPAAHEARVPHQVKIEYEDPASSIVTPLILAIDLGHTEIVDILLNHGADVSVTTDAGSNALHFAAWHGSQTIAEKLLEKNMDLREVRNNSGITPLLYAVSQGHPSVVKSLLAKKADIHATTDFGSTVLHFAARIGDSNLIRIVHDEISETGDTSEIRKLLEKRTLYKDTALFLAAEAGHEDAVKLLLSLGAEIGAKDCNEDTPLHIASQNGHSSVVDCLISHGANVDSENADGFTPLHCAARYGKLGPVNSLISHKANVYVQNEYGHTALHRAAHYGHIEVVQRLADEFPELWEKQTREADTAFTIAAQHNQLAVVRYLCSKGVNVHARDIYEDTALHLAIQDNHFDVVQYLVENTDLLEFKGAQGRTAICTALLDDELRCFEYLLVKGADLAATDKDGNTSLFYAARQGHIQAVERILASNSDLRHLRNKAGQTAIFAALDHGHFDISTRLLKEGIDVTTVDEDDNSIFCYAAAKGDLQSVESILEKDGGLLNSKDKAGRTAISAALANANLDVFDYLFDKNADLHAKDEDEKTPLHHAAESGLLRAVQQILTKEKDDDLLHSRDKAGQTATFAAIDHGHFDVFLHLLDNGADMPAMDKNYDFLHRAAEKGHLEAVRQILTRNSSQLNSEDMSGETALLLASKRGHLDVVEFLISQGANTLLQTESGRTALHGACYNGHKNVTRTLLNGRTDDSKSPSRDNQRAMITATDQWGDSPLDDAINENYTPIVFEILETELLYPRYPARANPFRLNDPERVEAYLSNVISGWTYGANSAEINEHWDAILYWALLNGKQQLINRCMNIPELPSPVPWKRDCSQVHVAALAGHVEIIEHLLLDGKCTWDMTQDNIMLLCLAVKYQHIELVDRIISWLEQSPEPVQGNVGRIREIIHRGGNTLLAALIRKQEDGFCAISLAASGLTPIHRSLASLLWRALDQTIGDKAKFFSLPLTEDALAVLELAAQFESPGEEELLSSFLKSIANSSSAQVNNPTALELATQHKLSVVVWWLLSRGGYHNGEDEAPLSLRYEWKKEDSVGKIIKDMIDNPPPVLQPQGLNLEKMIPAFNYEEKEVKAQVDEIVDGTVVDFYRGEHRPQRKNRSIISLIYGEGPHQVSKSGQYHDLTQLKAKVSEPHRDSLRKKAPDPGSNERDDEPTKSRSKSDIKNPKPATDAANLPNAEPGEKDKSSSNAEKQKILDLRWIHIPANNTRYVEELMVRLSRDQQITVKDHSPWAQFIWKNWVELSAGGKTSYMKPQCAHYGKTNHKDHEKEQAAQTGLKTDGTAKIDNQVKQNQPFRRSALNMPYVFWKKWPSVKKTDKSRPRSSNSSKDPTDLDYRKTQILEAQSGYKLHEYVTLDEYYYVSLQDAALRNRDQVLWRSTHPSREPKLSHGRGVDGNTDVPRESDGHCKILVVNQLWLWILDEKTIITSTTHQPDGYEMSFLHRVLIALKAHTNTTPMSAKVMRELIMSTASGLFIKQEIDVFQQKKSPLDVYREAILKVRDQEATLFNDFQESLPKEETENTNGETENAKEDTENANEGGPNSQSEQKSNPYGNISVETELLREVKDICDELRMLKALAENQEDVWKQIWIDECDPQPIFPHQTPSQIKTEIESLMSEVMSVEKAIGTLLNLKQKQANIMEAQFAREQSEETARQSVTIMVFTVVTILFLPASFLTSLLALNISDYPHLGDEVYFQGRVIFPIIFMISLFMSGMFIVMALNASALQDFWNSRKNRQDTRQKSESSARTPSHSSTPGLQVTSEVLPTSQQEFSLRRRIQKTLPCRRQPRSEDTPQIDLERCAH